MSFFGCQFRSTETLVTKYEGKYYQHLCTGNIFVLAISETIIVVQTKLLSCAHIKLEYIVIKIYLNNDCLIIKLSNGRKRCYQTLNTGVNIKYNLTKYNKIIIVVVDI